MRVRIGGESKGRSSIGVEARHGRGGLRGRRLNVWVDTRHDAGIGVRIDERVEAKDDARGAGTVLAGVSTLGRGVGARFDCRA